MRRQCAFDNYSLVHKSREAIVNAINAKQNNREYNLWNIKFPEIE